MIKIKVCDLEVGNSCSYYRGIGVLHQLYKTDPEISVEYIKDANWTTLVGTDILFFGRPSTPKHIQEIDYALSFGIPVWVDYDDNLHLVPDYNPGYEYHKDKNVLGRIESIIKAADILTVSTQTIKDCYWNLKPDDITVIPNAFNDFHYQLKEKNNNSNTISWRGSNTHIEDTESVENEIIDFFNNNKEWNFVVIGDNTHLRYITKREFIHKNFYIQPKMNPIRYNNFFYNINPEIHIIPLQDNWFNKSKSNCAWLEATYSGAVCLAPDFPEFDKPGIIRYKDKESFAYWLDKLAKNKNMRQKNYLKSFEYIKNNLLLSKINQERIKIIKDLIKK